MALDSYADLQTSLGNWLKRTNVADQVQDFITLAEVKLNRTLRVRQMRSVYSITPSQPFVTLPGDYSEAIRVKYGEQKLQFVAEYDADECMNQWDARGQFTITDKLWLLTYIDGTSKLWFHYYAQIPSLSVANTTNWLLQDAPDIYLFAALMEAERYIKNDPRVDMWRQALAEAVAALESNDDSGQHSGSALSMRAG